MLELYDYEKINLELTHSWLTGEPKSSRAKSESDRFSIAASGVIVTVAVLFTVILIFIPIWNFRKNTYEPGTDGELSSEQDQPRRTYCL